MTAPFIYTFSGSNQFQKIVLSSDSEATSAPEILSTHCHFKTNQCFLISFKTPVIISMKAKTMSKTYDREKIKKTSVNDEKLWRREMTNLRKLSLVVWQQTQLLESFSCLDVKKIINLNEEKQRFEISLIKIALFQTNGSQRKAAKLLGTTPSLLNNKIKRYKITINQTLNKI